MTDSSKKKPQPNVTKCKVCAQALPEELSAKRGPPFCSERCRLNDLSKWFGESYRIPSQPSPQSVDQQEEDEKMH
jgi:hypothetical protein